MSFIEVDAAFKVSRKHLDDTKSGSTEIESFLTRYLIVLVCGAFENEIRKLVVDRAMVAKDDDLTTFVTKTISNYRSLKASDLRGKLVGRFGQRHRDGFGKFMSEESEIVTRYNNIVRNRHSVAHGRTVNMTIDELEDSYRKSLKMIEIIRKLLGV